MITRFKTIFLSPHCDDETLFGAYTIMNEHPFVIFIEHTPERCKEAERAMEILGNGNFTFLDKFEDLDSFKADLVYAPALEGGHPLHDKVSKYATDNFENVLYYSTYRSGSDLQPRGDIKVSATPAMELRKLQALEMYKSQIIATPWHFELTNKDEYLCTRQ